jgi:hypothetical protein
VKLLVLDIETSPNLAYVWGLWDQNVGLNQIAELGSVICFAAKWVGDKKIHYHSDHHDGHDEMVKRAHELIDQADAVIHYNGKSFDIKHLNREFVLAGMSPPSPHKDIDLLTVARSRFRFASNKLDHVASVLGIGSKVHTGGFSLWVGCMKDDPKAWATMKKYNCADVTLTEAVYERLKPWIKNHPNRNLYRPDGDPLGCPTCGAPDSALKKRGSYRTMTCTYQRWCCTACGAWQKSTQREAQTYRTPI